jgi:hypothetical protein
MEKPDNVQRSQDIWDGDHRLREAASPGLKQDTREELTDRLIPCSR